MTQVTLGLTLDETNLVLEGLGNLPFVKVHELIGKIHEQASAQVMSNNNKGGDMETENPQTVENEA